MRFASRLDVGNASLAVNHFEELFDELGIDRQGLDDQAIESRIGHQRNGPCGLQGRHTTSVAATTTTEQCPEDSTAAAHEVRGHIANQRSAGATLAGGTAQNVRDQLSRHVGFAVFEKVDCEVLARCKDLRARHRPENLFKLIQRFRVIGRNQDSVGRELNVNITPLAGRWHQGFRSGGGSRVLLKCWAWRGRRILVRWRG